MAEKYPFVWRANDDVLAWVRQEAKRLRLTVAETIEIAVKFWQEHVEKEGDDKWRA